MNIEELFEEHVVLTELRKAETFLYFVQGKKLHEIKSQQRYLFAQGGISTWEDYLKQPEISLTATQAEEMIANYRFFCLDNGITVEQMGNYPLRSIKFLHKLARARKMDYDDIISSLDMTKVVSLNDLKENIQDIAEENGDKERTYEFVVFKRCKETNNITKVHDIDSDVIKKIFNLNE